MLQWIPGHCKMYGNEQADELTKNGESTLQKVKRDTSCQSVKLHIKKLLQDSNKQELTEIISTKSWYQDISNIPDWSRKILVATFGLTVGHDCLENTYTALESTLSHSVVCVTSKRTKSENTWKNTLLCQVLRSMILRGKW